MKAERYYNIERELRDFRDIVGQVLINNPRLPQHIRRPLEHRMAEAAAAINMAEDLYSVPTPLTIDEAWLELCEKSDRYSDHPDMCLITREELGEFMESAK